MKPIVNVPWPTLASILAFASLGMLAPATANGAPIARGAPVIRLIADHQPYRQPSHVANAVPTDATLLHYVRSIWDRLQAAGALPSWAQYPEIDLVDHDLGGAGGIATESMAWVVRQGEVGIEPGPGQVFFERRLLAAAIGPIGPLHDYAREAPIHEFAHTVQRYAMTQRDTEGGAQAWADQWAPRILRGSYSPPGDSTYAPYVAYVKAHYGWEWIDSGQFDEYGSPTPWEFTSPYTWQP